ncbi:endoribonuclease L-PSP [Gordoniibacillus kamchatkensis]|uniref:Endoribonuclease L-PSP n=1 Tax=Gordoniibacillus kamchatkensis TaxID=1590651 RepID=A0ABR5AMD6_9BACL|nr:RidA family protein [Paenibacillus sp. VKM B-2647]KIL42125.1 endoribonuclease L-PSP [Paenibacillus sp. VKM B-2647]
MPDESVAERLHRLGIVLPEASNPVANYANFVEMNGFLFVSGKGPSGNPRGKLGKEFTTEQGYRFARMAGIEVLAVVQSALGTLDKVKRVVKVQGFVNADPNYGEHHIVMNGFSDLMGEVFGEKGVHARSICGAVTLRDNLPLVVDTIFAVEE